jgi:hypothetical protein
MPYSHGMMNCLKENEGPGLRVVLTQDKTCKGRESYPRLEIDIREQPILAHKTVIIGPDNGAFRCLSQNESCEQALSGKVTFDHFSQDAVVNETDGSYDLQFRGGSERGRFAIECPGNC